MKRIGFFSYGQTNDRRKSASAGTDLLLRCHLLVTLFSVCLLVAGLVFFSLSHWFAYIFTVLLKTFAFWGKIVTFPSCIPAQVRQQRQTTAS